MARDRREAAGGEAGRLLRQRAALAEFGAEALSGADLDRVLAEAARLCAEALDVPFCKVLEPRPGGGLVVRAGVGWEPGVVGSAVVPADDGNPGGEAFLTGRPVVVPDLREAQGLDLPDLYPRHRIVSTANVPIPGGEGGRPLGVLEADAAERRRFGPDEIDFLRGYANVLASAVLARRREDALRAESEAKSALLLEQRHRVRNNLTAVAAMLQGGERGAADGAARARFGEVRRRVFAMAALYDHLLGADAPDGATCLRDYLETLCAGACEFHGLAERGIGLAFEGGPEPVPMPVDACTVLGVVVNELVANATEHAFVGPARGGRIAVRLLAGGEHGGFAVEVEDDGVGVPPGAEGRSVGLGVARRLAGQIGAALSLGSGPGRTVWTLAVPGGGARTA